MNPLDAPNPDAVVFVSVGSNIEPQSNVPGALNLLLQHVTVTGISTFCQTTAIGPPGQPSYINGVWQIHTGLSPGQLNIQVLRSIESQLGRMRTADRFAPRPIDLDLILYNDLILRNDGIELPHPDIDRPFVWMPILELLDAVPLDPVLASNISALLPSDQSASDWGIPLWELTRTLREKIQA
jgi:2-amino-4-hydroxy-6-hydroxymethyldihydropteridine diphosphokinase